MTSAELLIDGFGRVRESVHAAVEGLDPDLLAFRVDGEANSIAWLVWHLTRVQDDHFADAFDGVQVWTEQDWVGRFGLPFGPGATGYGQSFEEVAAVRAPAELLLGYHDAVHDQTVEHLRALTDGDLPRVIDDAWDPPVTLGVRLVSVLDDDLEHAGQAAFVRGIALRR